MKKYLYAILISFLSSNLVLAEKSINPEIHLTKLDVKSSQIVETVSYSVNLTVTAEAARQIQKYSKEHLGEKMKIVIEDKAVMTPVMRAPITDHALQISGLSKAEAEDLVKRLSK